jgi:hypothetical protein
LLFFAPTNCFRYSEIRVALIDRGITVDIRSVRRTCKRYDATQRVADLPRAARQQKYTKAVLQLVDDLMTANPESSTTRLRNIVWDRMQINVPLKSMFVIRFNLDWRRAYVKHGQVHYIHYLYIEALFMTQYVCTYVYLTDGQTRKQTNTRRLVRRADRKGQSFS